MLGRCPTTIKMRALTPGASRVVMRRARLQAAGRCRACVLAASEQESPSVERRCVVGDWLMSSGAAGEGAGVDDTRSVTMPTWSSTGDGGGWVTRARA